MAKTTKKKAGRPKAIIDWQKVGKMLEADCTAEGIAASLGIDRDTLYNRCRTDNKMDFSAFSQEKKAVGDDLLKMKQFQTAMAGNVVMQIWLGKQRLGQADKSKHELTGANGGAIEMSISEFNKQAEERLQNTQKKADKRK